MEGINEELEGLKKELTTIRTLLHYLKLNNEQMNEDRIRKQNTINKLKDQLEDQEGELERIGEYCTELEKTVKFFKDEYYDAINHKMEEIKELVNNVFV